MNKHKEYLADKKIELLGQKFGILDSNIKVDCGWGYWDRFSLFYSGNLTGLNGWIRVTLGTKECYLCFIEVKEESESWVAALKTNDIDVAKELNTKLSKYLVNSTFDFTNNPFNKKKSENDLLTNHRLYSMKNLGLFDDLMCDNGIPDFTDNFEFDYDIVNEHIGDEIYIKYNKGWKRYFSMTHDQVDKLNLENIHGVEFKGLNVDYCD